MSLRIHIGAIAAVVGLAAGGFGQTKPAPDAQQRAFLKQYCTTCHSQKVHTQGLDLETADLRSVSSHAEIWEKVVQKLRTETMPPAGVPHPDRIVSDSVAAWLENELDRTAAVHPNPGHLPALHRLNRAEYHNAIRDLVGLENVDVSVLLPSDDSSYGFDNIADILWLSPNLLERYLAAAEKISRVAVGDPAMPVASDTYRIPAEQSQDDRDNELPFGTRGGILIHRDFPLDGEYSIKIELATSAARAPDPNTLEVSIDGEKVKEFTVGGARPAGGRGGMQTPAPPAAQSGGRGGAPAPAPSIQTAQGAPAAQAAQGGGRGGAGGGRGAANQPLQLRIPVKAGPREVAVTFVKKTSAEPEDLIQPFLRPNRAGRADRPSVASVTITGPYSTTGSGDTPARQRLFVCRPASAADETVCARRILSTLARRAYRRPATDADIQILMPFFAEGRKAGTFDTGVEHALQRVLVSPSFLFRVEQDPPKSAPGGVARVSDLELASRLSFFLWSSIPDDQLLDLAIKGRLREPAVLDQQVKRMIADSRSRAFVDNFTGQWLYLRNLATHEPDPRIFPDFDDGLRQSFREETELFFDSLLRENRGTPDLLRADYTFVNERLAKHYGIPNIYGSQFRRVAVTDPNRQGLLGQGSILTISSYGNRTSPVLRGKWILENILGAAPPPPPPDVNTNLKTESAENGKALSMREAMVVHRTNPSCASCHVRMDPIGFSMENFDAIGRWRSESESKAAIDASGVLPDGTKFDGPAGLRQVLLSRPERFSITVTEKLMIYALGRGVDYKDAPAIRKIVREAAPGGYRLSSLVMGIVKSPPFQMRMIAPEDAAPTAIASRGIQ